MSLDFLIFEFVSDFEINVSNLINVTCYSPCPLGLKPKPGPQGPDLYFGPASGPTSNNGWGTHSKIVEYNTSSGNIHELDVGYPTNMWEIAAAIGNDGFVYFFGGHNGSNQDTIYKYNHIENSFSWIANLPRTMDFGISVSASNGLIYIFDAYARGLDSPTYIFSFNPTTLEVRQLTATFPSTIVRQTSGDVAWIDGDNIYIFLINTDDAITLCRFDTTN